MVGEQRKNSKIELGVGTNVVGEQRKNLAN